MRKVSRSLSGTEAAKHFASRALGCLRNFASVFNIEVAGVNVGVDPTPEPGLAESGDIQHDLPDLFGQIGRAAQAANKGWVLLIDEVQYLSQKDLSGLIVALHRMSQDGLPIVFVGAGLPQVARLAGDAKSYAERLFSYPAVGALDKEAASKAIEKPINDQKATISQEALTTVFDMTKGYPLFLQELALLLLEQRAGPADQRERCPSILHGNDQIPGRRLLPRPSGSSDQGRGPIRHVDGGPRQRPLSRL
ncbi:ATP-binding protein [Mesorhizobium australafricanum]|uniref:ATP-binding protein n=1 Tax=Mesorhizobium australafricanum TaxID=3072311 RepID=A0ABU4X7K9_9HYPH|nr:ATP-binding protein [Mesorhizobium sp. VK3E]MDX8443240.1 ATP-binding protein [Mesorhizobium sp. VK3E]